MRKFTIFLAFMLLSGLQVVLAQTTITGTVTSADDGAPLIGVSVVVKGTTIGATTDLDGKYELTVPEDATTLVFSYVGMTTKEIEIGGRTMINVELESAAFAMDEVVVTALGISREEKSLGYAVQDVNAEELTKARPNNALQALSGRVSGVQISSNTGNMGGSSRVLIRGASSVAGENQPLFVVDGVILDNNNFTSIDQARGGGGYDYGNAANDINPDDIESVSVLKGPAASALYGSRAANGVILITTKKGKARAAAGKKGIGVSINTGMTFDQVSKLPNYQNQYGGGFGWDTLWYSEHPEAFGNRTSGHYQLIGGDSYDLMPNYAVDESWGEELNGQMHRPWYSFNEEGIPEHFAENVPWVAHEDNVKNYFKTGQTWTNNIALTGGNENAYFRLSYTNMQQHGVYPNSKLDKNTINFSGSAKLGEKLTAFTNFNYVYTKGKARAGTGYDNVGRNVMGSFNQWFQRQLDMEKIQQYWINPDGTQNSWNRTSWDNAFPKYWDNPYWVQYMNYPQDQRNRLFGNIGMTYEFNDWLSVTGKVNKDFYADRRNERVAYGSNSTSYYREEIRQISETNAEFLFQVNKYLTEDLSLKANFGGNQMTRKYYRNQMQTQGGLTIPNFYNLANTTSPISVDDYMREKRINSLYGSASFGWRSMLYLDLTLRNDWSSTLPEGDNSYMYPSATASFVFSELGAIKNLDWLTFGKLRVGWAQVGNDTDPYQIYPVYNAKENFGSNPLYTVPNQLNNIDLKPEQTTSWEVGADVKFLNNRLGFDVTYYSMETSDQIFDVPLSGTTGYTSRIINAGKMTNKGIELMLMGTPVKTKDFSWDIYLNLAHNKNELVELTEGIDSYQFVNAPFAVSVNATVGEPYGTIKGRGFVYEDGQKLVDGAGMYVRTSDVVVLGNVMPDYTGGLGNTFNYKNISLSVLFDFRQGGDLFSTSYLWGMYSGMLEETVENNIREDGIVLEGVMEDPDNPGTYIPNTNVADANTYGLNHYFNAGMNMFDASFIKLREVSLTYRLPDNLLKKVPFQNVAITFVGRNLLVWSELEHIDPEHVVNAGNIQGVEGAQVPPLRSFGFNLSFNL